MTVTITTGIVVRAAFADEGVQRFEIHVALERVDDRWVAPLLDDQVDRLGAGELDVGPGRVEVGVAGDRLAGTPDDGEEDLLGRPALVGRDDVLEREEGLDAVEEAEPRG